MAFVVVNLEVFTAEAAELGVTMVPTFKFITDREVVSTVRGTLFATSE